MDWLIKGVIALIAVSVVYVAGYIDRKNGHYTPKEKRLRKQWEAEREAEEKVNQEFRAASKPLTQQSFEEWKAANKKQP